MTKLDPSFLLCLLLGERVSAFLSSSQIKPLPSLAPQQYVLSMAETIVEASPTNGLNGGTSNKASSSSKLQSNTEMLEELYPDYPRTWVPLGSTKELDPDRPTRVEFLGQSYVTYFSNSTNQWVVMDNTCPHRLAPLSEGRVEPETGRLQCSYHGWTYGSDGICQRIPQAPPAVEETAVQNARACVPTYTTNHDEHTGVIWIWPWQQDPLAFAKDEWRHPEGMMKNVVGLDSASAANCSVVTYTRDHPYGWDTLIENLIDPSHIPFAHHGMQGSRKDAIPINMTRAVDNGPAGFSFQWQDRTMGQMRSGMGEFRAPYLVSYDAKFAKAGDDDEPPRPFRLSVLCIPTTPGKSRVMVFNVKQEDTKGENAAVSTQASTKEAVATKKEKRPSLVATLFKILPTWVSHLLSNKFFDSDVAFLHYQEQLRYDTNNPKQRGDARYFMPAECDRSISAFHGWMGQYAKSYLQRQSSQLPPAIYDRSVLFDRWTQHTAHCKICQGALAGIQKWKQRSQWAMALSIVVGFRHWPARLLAVACLGVVKVLNNIEGAFYKGEFKHYENH